MKVLIFGIIFTILSFGSLFADTTIPKVNAKNPCYKFLKKEKNSKSNIQRMGVHKDCLSSRGLDEVAERKPRKDDDPYFIFPISERAEVINGYNYDDEIEFIKFQNKYIIKFINSYMSDKIKDFDYKLPKLNNTREIMVFNKLPPRGEIMYKYNSPNENKSFVELFKQYSLEELESIFEDHADIQKFKY